MENTNPVTPRTPNPRRKKRSRFQKIVRAYFPAAIVLALVVLFIIFAVGSVRRANEKREAARQESLAAEASFAQMVLELEMEAKALVKEAENMAAGCEFDKAIEHLDTFSGNPDEFEVIVNAIARFKAEQAALVSIGDVSQVKTLSFGRILRDDSLFKGDLGDDNRYNYISAAEFTRILQELYNNGYMLVDIYDLFTTTTAEDGSTLIVQNDLKLPQGKKPIMLVNIQPNGYENKLVVAGDGSVDSERFDADTIDFVPLLDDFINSNPGFSYQGARAVISITAHKGLFGYELTETAQITKISQALRDSGYILASNTYGNLAYGKISLLELVDDLSNWDITVTPLIGETEVLVVARSSDLEDSKEAYSGKRYDKTYEAGFHYYFGICYNSAPWMSITDNTIRIGRIMVNGNNLMTNAALYEGLFDTNQVLDK